MTLDQQNAILASRDFVRRKWDLGLRLSSLPALHPMWTNHSGMLIQRRWIGDKHPRPNPPAASGFALASGASVSSDAGAAFANNTLYWLAVDAVSGGGILTESPPEQAQLAVWGAAGHVGAVPNAPTDVRCTQIAGGKALVTWLYSEVEQQATPTVFQVYSDNGTGVMDWTEPVGSVVFTAGRRFYSFTTAVLTPGVKTRFNVRAQTAGGVLSLTPAIGDGYLGTAALYEENSGAPVLVLTAAAEDPETPAFV